MSGSQAAGVGPGSNDAAMLQQQLSCTARGKTMTMAMTVMKLGR
jgi:hypothetical protein